MVHRPSVHVVSGRPACAARTRRPPDAGMRRTLRPGKRPRSSCRGAGRAKRKNFAVARRTRAIAPIRAPPGGRLRQVAGSWPGIAGLSGLPAWVPETSGQVNIGLICGGRGIKSEQSRTDGGKLMAKSAPVRKLSQAVGTGVADLPSNAAWLLSKALKSGRGPAEAAAQAASSVAGGVSDKATAAAETAGSATSAARETAGSATSAARETAGSATSAARKNARAAGRAITQVMPATWACTLVGSVFLTALAKFSPMRRKFSFAMA